MQFPGVVYRRFQEQLLTLRASGVLLALCSKNDEADVKEAFETLDMPLKWEHFSAVRVNWRVKSQNIADIASELNLGLDALVFVDDSPFELSEVACALPQVDCYSFDGRKPREALGLLASIKDLGIWAPTDEDSVKAQHYEQNKLRQHAQEGVALEDYLRGLEMTLQVGLNRRTQVKRIAQLTNKTNQFNLSTKRYDEAEILAVMERASVYDFRVIDRFGDLGIVGVVIVENAEIDTFLLSCRALGRDVEVAMLRLVCDDASISGLQARYVPSPKNRMVEHFFDKCGFDPIVDAQNRESKVYRLGAGPRMRFEIEIKRVD
jgi:FkbH-like protein